MKILLTGGAGYIGSHIYLELFNKGYNTIILDNFTNSGIDTITQLAHLTGSNIEYYNIDICDKKALENFLINNNDIDIVIHCAGLKSVPDSILNPLKYYENNVLGTLNLISLMNKYNINKLVFSSSASIYGDQKYYPIKENAKIEPLHPYGQSKAIIEQVIKDYANSNKRFSAVILRYFNPIGAHNSGLIGEFTMQKDMNIMSYILKVAQKGQDYFNIYGYDYDTHDGTAIRDFIHVVDLARGHVSSLDYLLKNKGVETFNLGTGKGHTVLDLVKSFEKVNNIDIPQEYSERRQGDIPISYADVSKAQKLLQWKPTKSLEDMCYDSWNRISNYCR